MEIEESIINLQKTTMHYSLLPSNHLICFYAILYARTDFKDSSPSTKEKLLAQEALRISFNHNRYSNNCDTNNSVSDDDSKSNVNVSADNVEENKATNLNSYSI